MVNQYAGEKSEVRLWVWEGISRACGQQDTNKFDFIKGVDIMRIRKKLIEFMKIIHKNLLVIGLAITASSAFSGSPSDFESKEVNFAVMNWTPEKINYSVSIPVDPRERCWYETYDFSKEVDSGGGLIEEKKADKAPVILNYIENKAGICETEGFEFPVVVKNYDVFVVSNDAADVKACLVKKQIRTTE